jgi:hypothetical protein
MPIVLLLVFIRKEIVFPLRFLFLGNKANESYSEVVFQPMRCVGCNRDVESILCNLFLVLIQFWMLK